MIATQKAEGQENLSPEQLAAIRDCWGMGVKLRTLAAQHGLTEAELLVQLRKHRRPMIEPPAGQRGSLGLEHIQQMRERRRQLQALKVRFGGDNG
jgi:hypothetical protein